MSVDLSLFTFDALPSDFNLRASKAAISRALMQADGVSWENYQHVFGPVLKQALGKDPFVWAAGDVSEIYRGEPLARLAEQLNSVSAEAWQSAVRTCITTGAVNIERFYGLGGLQFEVIVRDGMLRLAEHLDDLSRRGGTLVVVARK